MLHGEMSGERAPLGAVRRPKRASTFSLVKRFFFLREKEMFQTPIISKIIYIIWGHIQRKYKVFKPLLLVLFIFFQILF